MQPLAYPAITLTNWTNYHKYEYQKLCVLYYTTVIYTIGPGFVSKIHLLLVGWRNEHNSSAISFKSNGNYEGVVNDPLKCSVNVNAK